MAFHLDIAKIIRDKGLDVDGPVQRMFTHTCRIEMDEFIPQDEGNLRTIVYEGIDYIIYESPYATYQYFGERKDGSHKVVNYTTEGTGPFWDKEMWSAKKEKIMREVANEIKRRR